MKPQKIPCTVVENNTISPTTQQIELALEGTLEFEAGQFGYLTLEEGKRPYSIASAPWEKTISLCVKKVEGGQMSTMICSLSVGTKALFFAPMGMFTLPKNGQTPIVFIAVGTGIAPIRGMIRQLYQHKYSGDGTDTTQEVHVLFGARTRDELLYHEEFTTLQEVKSFKYHPVLSREKGMLEGHVQNHLETVMNREAKYFLCGLSKMVNEVKEHLLAKGIPQKNIHMESYG